MTRRTQLRALRCWWATAAIAGAAGPWIEAWSADTPNPTIRWPGEAEGPASVLVAPSTLVLFGTFGVIGIPSDIADADLPSSTATKETTDNAVRGDVRQQGTTKLTTTMWSSAGRLHVQSEVTGSHTYTKVDGTPLGRQTSTAVGYFQVLVCPNPQGVADGSLSLALRQETTRADGTVTAAVSTAEGGFAFYDGDDAYRNRTAMNLTITVGGRTSTADDVSWGVDVPLQYEWSRRGSPDVTAGGEAAWNWAGEIPANALKNTSVDLLALKIVTELEKPVEEFWRSGKCIKLRAHPHSGDVEPDQKLTVKLEAKHKLDDEDVEAPITAAFSGVKAVEPVGAPVDPPAEFEFTAGSHENDRGTIDFTQTGRRGIGRETATYRVKPGDVYFSMEASFILQHVAGTGEIRWAVPVVKLEKQPDGTFRGRGEMRGGVNIQGAGGSATGGGMGTIEITARQDEADRNRFYVTTKTSAAGVTVRGTSRGGGSGTGSGSAPPITAVDRPITIDEPIVLTPSPGVTVTYRLTRRPLQ